MSLIRIYMLLVVAVVGFVIGVAWHANAPASCLQVQTKMYDNSIIIDPLLPGGFYIDLSPPGTPI